MFNKLFVKDTKVTSSLHGAKNSIALCMLGCKRCVSDALELDKTGARLFCALSKAKQLALPHLPPANKTLTILCKTLAIKGHYYALVVRITP